MELNSFETQNFEIWKYQDNIKLNNYFSESKETMSF